MILLIFLGFTLPFSAAASECEKQLAPFFWDSSTREIARGTADERPKPRAYEPPYGPATARMIGQSRTFLVPRAYTESQRRQALQAFNDYLVEWLSSKRDLRGLIDRASTHLEAQGVAHRIRKKFLGRWFIEILPEAGAGGRLNKVATALAEKYRARLIFDPAAIVHAKAIARFTPPSRTIELPFSAVSFPDHFASPTTHELQHLRTEHRKEMGEVYPFYGSVSAVVSIGTRGIRELPFLDIKAVDGGADYDSYYRSSFPFDEIDAHHVELRRMAQSVARISRQATEEDQRPYSALSFAREELFFMAMRVYDLARRTMLLAEAVLPELSTPPLFTRGKNGVMGVKAAVLDKRIFVIVLPLLQSKCAKDADNPGFFRAQIELMRDRAARRRDEAAEYLKAEFPRQALSLGIISGEK